MHQAIFSFIVILMSLPSKKIVLIALIILLFISGSAVGAYLYIFDNPKNESEVYLTEGIANNPFPTTSTTGSISVCKIIIDKTSISEGPNTKEAKFTIKGIKQSSLKSYLPSTTFTTPLKFNADLLLQDGKLDAECTKYKDLAFGDYYYDKETGVRGNWLEPLYHDNYDPNATQISDFSTYKNILNNSQPNSGIASSVSDGLIKISVQKPHRYLVIVNRYQTTNPIASQSANLGCYVPCKSNNECQTGYRCLEINRVYRCAKTACPVDETCQCTHTSTSTSSEEMQQTILGTQTEYEQRQEN